MNSETIVYLVVALLLGMLLANMLKNVCGCKNIVEGQVRRGTHGQRIPSPRPVTIYGHASGSYPVVHDSTYRVLGGAGYRPTPGGN